VGARLQLLIDGFDYAEGAPLEQIAAVMQDESASFRLRRR
jgi:hypothetical protein